MSEGPRAAEMIYKSVRQAKEQDAIKWVQQKEKGWKIIIDYLSLVTYSVSRCSNNACGRTMYRDCGLKCAESEINSTIARCMKKLQNTCIEGEALRACYDDFLTS